MSERTMTAISNRAARVLALIALASLTACGGSHQPAESPEAVPAATPEPEAPAGDSSSMPAGEHTMPDGTKMPGHEHGDGSHQHQH